MVLTARISIYLCCIWRRMSGLSVLKLNRNANHILIAFRNFSFQYLLLYMVLGRRYVWRYTHVRVSIAYIFGYLAEVALSSFAEGSKKRCEITVRRCFSICIYHWWYIMAVKWRWFLYNILLLWHMSSSSLASKCWNLWQFIFFIFNLSYRNLSEMVLGEGGWGNCERFDILCSWEIFVRDVLEWKQKSIVSTL